MNYAEKLEAGVKIKSEKEAKTLEFFWNTHQDKLYYFIKPFNRLHVTKHIILSDILQIFDPLSLLEPVILYIVAAIIVSNN